MLRPPYLLSFKHQLPRAGQQFGKACSFYFCSCLILPFSFRHVSGTFERSAPGQKRILDSGQFVLGCINSTGPAARSVSLSPDWRKARAVWSRGRSPRWEPRGVVVVGVWGSCVNVGIGDTWGFTVLPREQSDCIVFGYLVIAHCLQGSQERVSALALIPVK